MLTFLKTPTPTLLLQMYNTWYFYRADAITALSPIGSNNRGYKIKTPTCLCPLRHQVVVDLPRAQDEPCHRFGVIRYSLFRLMPHPTWPKLEVAIRETICITGRGQKNKPTHWLPGNDRSISIAAQHAMGTFSTTFLEWKQQENNTQCPEKGKNHITVLL